MLKLSLFIFIFSSCLFGQNVIIAKESFKFEELLVTDKLVQKNVDIIKKNCIPLSIKEIESTQYLTTHFINKNSVICQKDVKKGEQRTVIFNFGGLQIEKKGTVISENEEYIKIKKQDGTIEKIYKDGRLK